jgi:hypothetical protein
LTTAEVGVALAGFSGIAVSLGRRAQGEWDAADRLRLRDLLVAALGAALFGFLPVVLTTSGRSEAIALQYSSALLAMYYLLAAATMLRGASGRFGAMTWAMLLPTLLILAMLSLVGAGSIHRAASFSYVLALFWLLIISGANFARLLLHQTPAKTD